MADAGELSDIFTLSMTGGAWITHGVAEREQGILSEVTAAVNPFLRGCSRELFYLQHTFLSSPQPTPMWV